MAQQQTHLQSIQHIDLTADQKAAVKREHKKLLKDARKYGVSQKESCWRIQHPWTKPKNCIPGIGWIWFGRIAWMRKTKKRPTQGTNYEVVHLCANPYNTKMTLCVNPDHTRWRTHRWNISQKRCHRYIRIFYQHFKNICNDKNKAIAQNGKITVKCVNDSLQAYFKPEATAQQKREWTLYLERRNLEYGFECDHGVDDGETACFIMYGKLQKLQNDVIDSNDSDNSDESDESDRITRSANHNN